MDGRDIRLGRGPPGADGPNRLIGDDATRRGETVRQAAGQLPGDHRLRLARQPLRLALADTDNGDQARSQCSLRLGPHHGIRLAMISPALGMAEDHIGCPDVPQHGRGHIAGMGPLGRRMTVLPAQRHPALGQGSAHGHQVGKGWADQQLGSRLRAGLHGFRKGGCLPQRPVHLPIAGDQRTHSGGHGGILSVERNAVSVTASFGNGRGLGYGPSPDHRRTIMLTALRRLASTWVAKLLFVLLISSFAVWGIGDTIRNFGQDTAVARVGGTPIEMDEAQAAVRREMQRLSRQVGGQFENDPRIRRAVAQQAIEQLVLDRVLRGEARDLGITVPDEAVRDFIFSIQGFRGMSGQFERAVFENFLRTNDMTEGTFLALVRADLARQQLALAVRSGATAPEVLTKPLLQWQLEQRSAALVTLPLAAAPEPPAPEEAQLRRFHENNPDRFSTPEYREASVAVLTAERISREVEISDADIAAAYESRRNQFETPERRALAQVLVQDEEKAKAIAAAWSGGADFAAVTREAEAAGGQALELGSLDRAGLPFPQLAEAAFGTAVGSVTAPIRTDFGWHILKVESAEPGATRPLTEVRDQIRTDLTAEKAADLAFERANQVEDALAGGATLAEVAQRFNLGFAAIRTDANGMDPEDKPVELPVIEAARAPLLRAIFTAEKGAAPRLAETEAGFVAVDIKEISPPALRPFESVEPLVREAFIAEARRRSQEERAAGLLAAVKGGKSLADAARESGFGVREVGAITRDQRDGAIPPELLAPLFELKANEPTMAQTQDGYAVAQLLEVTRPDPGTDAAALARLKAEVTQAMAGDLETEYVAALRNRADVRINPRLVDNLAQP